MGAQGEVESVERGGGEGGVGVYYAVEGAVGVGLLEGCGLEGKGGGMRWGLRGGVLVHGEVDCVFLQLGRGYDGPAALNLWLAGGTARRVCRAVADVAEVGNLAGEPFLGLLVGA